MPQFARPDSDVTVTNYTGTPDNTNRYTNIDETTADTADYLSGSASGVYECGLSDVTNPIVNSRHVVRYWGARNSAFGTANVTVSLYQGATLIASKAESYTSSTPELRSFTLTTGEAANITDYTDLRIRFTGPGVGSAHRFYWAEVEVPSYTTTTLVDNLVSYWEFDETSGDAPDSIGSNTLTDTNTCGTATGKVANARELLHANNERFQLASPSGLAPGTSDFSISFWVYLTGSGGSGYDSIIHWGNQSSANPYIWVVCYPGQNLHVQFVDGLSGYNTMNTGVNISTSTWTQITLVFDRDGNMTTYKNGTSSATNSISGHQGSFSPSTGFAVGSYYNDPGTSMDGYIDEVKFWHRALTGAEVTEDYNAGAAGGAVGTGTPAEPFLPLHRRSSRFQPFLAQ